VRCRDGRVSLTLELPAPGYPRLSELAKSVREAVAAVAGVESVELTTTWRVRAGESRHAPLPGVQNVVAVASGKGGVGKSTVAVNLAVALSESGAKVGLLDCDIYGPSIPLMLGISGRPQVTGDKKIVPLMSHGLRLMSIGFLAGENAPVIWRGPMVHGVIRQFLSDVKWGELDYLVLDLPPGTGDAALTICQTAPLAGAVIVTTPQEMSLIDARKGLQMFRRVNVPVLGIVENMSFFVCDGCQKRHALFGEGGAERAAKELETDVLARLPLQPDVVEAGDSGKPTVLSSPSSPAAAEFRALAGVVARKLALLAAETPPVLGGNIEWVNTP
jgi:ATP-binding protein involved in chromosome partitioning